MGRVIARGEVSMALGKDSEKEAYLEGHIHLGIDKQRNTGPQLALSIARAEMRSMLKRSV